MRSPAVRGEASPGSKQLPVHSHQHRAFPSAATNSGQQSSPAVMSLRQENYGETPSSLDPFHESITSPRPGYIIIALHTPPKRTPNEAVKQGSQGKLGTAGLKGLELRSQLDRRSTEKRFYSPGPICRICHEGDIGEDLISPCDCSGSLQFVHKSCLEKWLTQSNIDSCEICQIRMPVVREARSIWQWFHMPTAPYGPSGFYADMCCVLMLTPLCLVSVYLCAIGAVDYMRHGVWEGIGLAILCAFLLSTYVLWCFVTVRFHIKTVARWREQHQVIHLIDAKCQRRRVSSLETNNNASPVNTLVSVNCRQPTPQTHVVGSRPIELQQSDV